MVAGERDEISPPVSRTMGEVFSDRISDRYEQKQHGGDIFDNPLAYEASESETDIEHERDRDEEFVLQIHAAVSLLFRLGP